MKTKIIRMFSFIKLKIDGNLFLEIINRIDFTAYTKSKWI